MGVRGGVRALKDRAICPKLQDVASLDQIAVQNTWYTILDTVRNPRIHTVWIMMATADETIEVRCTIDGKTVSLTGTNFTLGTGYLISLSGSAGALSLSASSSGNKFAMTQEAFDCESFKVEFRKTTAAGANHLFGRVTYQKW